MDTEDDRERLAKSRKRADAAGTPLPIAPPQSLSPEEASSGSNAPAPLDREQEIDQVVASMTAGGDWRLAAFDLVGIWAVPSLVGIMYTNTVQDTTKAFEQIKEKPI
eukprot:5702594-Amphidinium_carterae.1